MKNSVKLNREKRTAQKYFNSQKRVVEILRKSSYVHRTDLETVKNIGQIPWNFMINCLTVRQEDKQTKQGRNKIKYCWNGTEPSAKIAEGMIRAMRANSKSYREIVEVKVPQPTSMKEVGMAEQQASCIVISDKNLDDFLEVEHMIIDLHDRITILEAAPKNKQYKKPQLLSRWLSAAKNYWHRNSSFRYFIYYIVIWTISTSSLVTYYNW